MFFASELHALSLKEATDDDVTSQEQTHDPPKTTNNESKHIKPLANIFSLSEFVPTSLIGCFYPLAQKELDYLYSAVNEKDKPPNHEPKQENTETQSPKSTAT